MTGPPRVLLLGGTTEATALAGALAEQDAAGSRVDLIVSFAGRTNAPTAPFGEVRVGGFGGTAGLKRYLADSRIDAVIDALHPFAAVMPFHAHAACAAANISLLKLLRPGWTAEPADRWTRVATMADVPDALAALVGRRVLLTVGRQDLDPFRTVDGVRFVVRSIEPADLTGTWDAHELLDRGPYTVERETDLLAREQIAVMVTKDSGGSATAAKLTAARELGVPVVMVDRPALPPVEIVTTVDEALSWLRRAPTTER